MPVARRRTRIVTRKKLVIHEDFIQTDELSLNERLDLFLEDFDRQVEIEIENLKKKGEELCKTIKQQATLDLVKMTKALKMMPWTEYLAKGNTISGKIWLELIKSAQNESQYSTTDDALDAVKPAREATPTESESSIKVLEAKSQPQRKTRKGAKKAPLSHKRRCSKAKGVNLSVARKRPNLNTSSAQKRNIETPIISNPSWASATPLFTPKFDPRFALTPATGLRRVKPDEPFIIMSMSGSPMFLAPTNRSPPALISLENGTSVAVSRKNMDEDTKAKLALMKQQLSVLAVNSAS